MVNMSAIQMRLSMMENSINYAWIDEEISDKLQTTLLECLQECIYLSHGANPDGSFPDVINEQG